jgi:hypothetical protein
MKLSTTQLKRSKEWADAISRGKKGHKHSDETKRKIGLKSANRSKETIAKISQTLTGRKRPQWEKDKISKNNARYWLNKKRPEISGENSYYWGGKNSLRGDKNPSWKGGITPINKKIRSSLEYKLWREAVFKRDNWTCVWCGVRGVYLHADHIKRFADYPELRFALDNGRTLCVPCHKTTETYGRKKQK